MKHSAALFLLSLMISARLAAQQDTAVGGVIEGYLKYKHGFHITGESKVSIESLNIHTESTSDGNFRFSGLKPGKYTLTAEVPGSRPAKKRNVLVESQKVTTVTIRIGNGPFYLLKELEDNWIHEKTIAVHIGMRVTGEIGLGYADYSLHRGDSHVNRVRVGALFSYSPANYYLGPAISMHHSFMPLIAGGSLRYMTNFHQGGVYVVPQMGIGLIFFQVYVGYQQALYPTTFNRLMNKLELTLSIPINSELYGKD